MVSALPGFLMTLAFASAAPLLSAQSSLLDSTRQPRPATPEVKTEITPEVRGDIFMARKMYRDAIDVYRQCPANSPVTWNKIGIAYHQLLDFKDAQKNYEKALKVDPKYSEAMNNVGTIYYARKSYGGAIRRYKAAIRLKPDTASYYSNLGTAYFARKDYKNAALMYQTAIKLDPDIFENHNTVGTTMQDRSVEELAKFHYYLARTYAKSGQKDRALLYIRKSLEEGFKDRQLYMEQPEFAALRDDEDFKNLMALQPRVL